MVDAAQGVEAQTLANVYQSIEHDHEIVPVINKVDLPAADPEGRAAGDRGDHRPRRSRAPCSPAPRPASASSEVLQAIVDAHPAAQRRRRRAVEGDARRQLVRPLSRRRHPRPRDRRRLQARRAGQVHARRHRPPGRPRRLLPPQDRATERARPGRDRLHHRADQGSRRDPRRRHHHRRPPPRRGRAARLQAGPAGGLLRPLSGRRQRLREAPRLPLQAPPQRRLVQLRDGDQRRPGLRLPLRLSRPAPPRDHPGAADPRI